MSENNQTQLTSVSKASTVEAIVEFWETHSLADYWDQTHEVNFTVTARRRHRVTLDPVLKDGHGIPAPKIDYTISANSRKMMDHGLARGREILEAAGATDICINDPIPWGGWHLLGTARMGTDPERSVVNEWGRSHDVKNLFIVDGSVFVTGGGVNPTSTIQAVALYVADEMKKRLADLFD